MVPILVMMTVVGCIGIKALTPRGRKTHIAEKRNIRRNPWGLTEEAFLKC